MTDPNKVYNAEISFYCKKFIYTQGAGPVVLRADSSFQKTYPVEKTEVVSTIGAGDNFNAGFIFGLLKYGITRQNIEQGLSPEQWDKVIAQAQRFSVECCKSLFNYVGEEFGETMKQEFNNK